MNASLATLACVVYGAFIAGVWFVFRRVEPDPPMLRLLKVCAVIAAIAYVVAILGSPPGTVRKTVGATAYMGALALFLWAAAHTRTRRLSLAFSSDRPTFLLTTGPWKHVRHPFYAAYLLSYAAGSVVSGVWWTILVFLTMSTLYFRSALLEERKLAASELASDWTTWKSRTGMFLPRVPLP